MAEAEGQGGERTEEPTDERRDEFRKRGEVALSRELTSVLTLAATIGFISLAAYDGFRRMQKLFITQFTNLADFRISDANLMTYLHEIWGVLLVLTLPILCAASIIAIFVTFAQTRLNVSFQRVAFDFAKMDPLRGLARLVSGQSAVELLKGIGKMFVIASVLLLILWGERSMVPNLLNLSIFGSSAYWSKILGQMLWSTAGLLLVIAGADYLYTYVTIEGRMKMSKQELKEEFRKREVDPMVRNRMRKMQRDIANRKTIDATRKATVLITNPTHFACAIQYEIGMAAPILIAKGSDFLALRMREIAAEENVPIVENKPLAQTIYKTMDIGQEVPASMYKALSEIIRYVFKLKGVRVPSKAKTNIDVGGPA